jgi:hypothetical protein
MKPAISSQLSVNVRNARLRREKARRQVDRGKRPVAFIKQRFRIPMQ